MRVVASDGREAEFADIAEPTRMGNTADAARPLSNLKWPLSVVETEG